MALYAKLSHHATAAGQLGSPERPLSSMRRFSFEDGEQRVDAGSAVWVTRGAPPACLEAGAAEDSDDFEWSAANTADFLAGGPLTLSWVTKTAEHSDNAGVYVCCWVTVGD